MKKFNCLFKISAIALTVAMMATVVSCGSKDDDSKPPAPTLSITPAVTSITFLAEGQTNTFTVETNQTTWNVNSSDPSWLTATKSGTGFTVTATANNTSSDRTATVTVSATGAANVTITVQQPKIPAEAPTLSINPSVTNIQFSATGNVVTSNGNPITPTFTVETNQTTWDVNSSAPTWLTATKSGTNFTVTAESNDTETDRTATLTVSAAGVANVTINVQQKSGHEDITAQKLTNYAMPFKHKAAAIIDQGAMWNYDVDGGWLYNTVGGTNGVVFANADGSYNCTLSMSVWSGAGFPVENMVNGKLYQTVELEAGSYKFTANIFAVWGELNSSYVVAASGSGLPDIGALNSALGSKQIPAENGEGLPPVTVEFTLSAKTTVSLGFVANITNAEFHISSVQLLWKE